MPRKNYLILFFVAYVALLPGAAAAQSLLADGLVGTQGSTVGPDGALYVTEGGPGPCPPDSCPGSITRVDPWSGEKTEFASGLPSGGQLIPGLGGPVDVAFIDGTAYALVSLAGGCLGLPDADGIYRHEGGDDWSVLADLGAWSRDNPPTIPSNWVLPCGVPYAMEPFRGGLLVTDGHHNRVLWVSPEGEISEFKGFGNIIPTGLEVHGKTVLMAEAGPIPHWPEDGKVIAIDAKSGDSWEIASGAPLLVDVELGLGRSLYALAQGEWCPPGETPPTCGKFDGAPAEPNGGSLVQVNADGSVSQIAGGLNLPTSLEFIGNSAYIVNMLGEIWVIDDVSDPPFGVSN